MACLSTGCLAVGADGTLLRTQDLRHWSSQSSGTTYPLYSAACWTGPAQPYCCAAGFRGTIVGGQPFQPEPWTAMSSGTYQSLNRVMCGDYSPVSPCAVVGDGGFFSPLSWTGLST